MTKALRLLLAYKGECRGNDDPYGSLLPIGLGYLNALARRHGFQSRLANLSSLSWSRVEAVLREERPHILAISVFTHNRAASFRLARLAKKLDPHCFVVIGGPHATPCCREILAGQHCIDAVVIGEGEETFLDLVTRYAAGGEDALAGVPGIAFRGGGGIAVTAPRPPVRDLDLLPMPAEGMDTAIGIDVHRQLEFIVTSRGCPSSCTFCGSPGFWGKGIRFRSPRSVVDEIRHLRDRYGLIYFSIRDDTFTVDRARTIEFCRLLLREKIYVLWNCQSRVSAVDGEMLLWMKRAGCECIQFGVESGSTEVLRKLGKRITVEQVRRAARATREAGIRLSIYLIAGVPGEREEDLAATCRLIDEIRPADGQVSPLAYYPGTALFAEAVKNGAVSGELFDTEKGEAFFVSDGAASREGQTRLLTRLTRAAGRSRFSPAEFAAQKKALGFCHTSNVIAGETYEEEGEFDRAEREYREIVERQPDNPWGWLSLAELYATLRRWEDARRMFEGVTRLVPGHASAREALKALSRRK